jgi:hypothetical protein
LSKKKRNKAQVDPTVNMSDWLYNRNPLVTITRQRSPGVLSRAMGFVYELLPSGRVVLCTCRHNFLEVEDLTAFTYLGGFNREEQYSPFHANPLSAADERDISFIVARRVTMAQRLKLCDARAFDKWHATEEGILYNCRNAIGESVDSQLYVARQTIGPPRNPDHRAWINMHVAEKAHMLPDTDTVELPALRERGYLEHGFMRMYTRPGFSGSPIWDDQLRLIGMNIRGTYGGSEGDYCAYVYTGDIRRAFEDLRPRILEIDRGPVRANQ